MDQGQGRVERGVRFFTDPLVLASSVVVNNPERVGALCVIMVLCFRVSRLAEHRLRPRLTETTYTIPDQRNCAPPRPPMRWIVPCCEGIERLHVRSATGTQALVVRLHPVHRLVLTLLGPVDQDISHASG
jgi:hypothetical protein